MNLTANVSLEDAERDVHKAASDLVEHARESKSRGFKGTYGRLAWFFVSCSEDESDWVAAVADRLGLAGVRDTPGLLAGVIREGKLHEALEMVGEGNA